MGIVSGMLVSFSLFNLWIGNVFYFLYAIVVLLVLICGMSYIFKPIEANESKSQQADGGAED